MDFIIHFLGIWTFIALALTIAVVVTTYAIAVMWNKLSPLKES